MCRLSLIHILFSSDMMELIGLSDRIITMYEGRITGELSGDEIREEVIMRGAMKDVYKRQAWSCGRGRHRRAVDLRHELVPPE